jgi:FkbM family methyltransferase
MPSQFGEELIIRSAFSKNYKGYAVDVGASDGWLCSNTLALEENGWDVLCIEPNPRFECEKNRKRVLNVAVGRENLDDQDFSVVTIPDGDGYTNGNWSACSALHPDQEAMAAHSKLISNVEKIKVNVRTLDWCLEEANFPKLDFVSIDTEGGDMDVLLGWDIKKWLPRMIIIENWNERQPFGAVLSVFNYERIGRLGVNDIFVHF